MPKKESENQFLRSFKGRNSVLISQKLPIYNPRTLLPNINSHSKFEENWLKMLPAESENDALTDRLTDGQTDRRTDGRTLERICFEWRVQHNTPHFLSWRDIISL